MSCSRNVPEFANCYNNEINFYSNYTINVALTWCTLHKTIFMVQNSATTRHDAKYFSWKSHEFCYVKFWKVRSKTVPQWGLPPSGMVRGGRVLSLMKSSLLCWHSLWHAVRIGNVDHGVYQPGKWEIVREPLKIPLKSRKVTNGGLPWNCVHATVCSFPLVVRMNEL